MTTTLDAPTIEAPTRPSIQTNQLRKNYGKVQALDGVDLTLGHGQLVGLMGPNGCGKTTLLKILAGVLLSYAGNAEIAGHRPGPESKANVSFLPDTDFLPRSWTIEKSINFFEQMFIDFNATKARSMIQDFELQPAMKFSEMSKGMGEKAQLALAMSRRAEVYLMDEPISGVDPAARDVLLDGIVRNLEPGSLVMISTHLVHDLEPVLDTAIFMHHGRILKQGNVDDLRAEHGKSLDDLTREIYR